MDRRNAFTRRSALALAAGAVGALRTGEAGAEQQPPAEPLKGRIKQSVSQWCYSKIPLDTLCENAKAMGLVGIDLLHEAEWPTVAKHGLLCTMAYGIGTIPNGWNDLKSHDRLVAETERMIPKVAAAGLPNIITFSGNRRGLTDAQGGDNCVAGLQRIAKLAERHKVTVCMELLNSKHDHKDYQCDHTAWGVEVCKRVGSDRIKLLYDIYHMQIMEGDVIRTLRNNIQHIGHFHTAGNPGRNELDESQELYYPAIMRAIAATNYDGYVGQEFSPLKDASISLEMAYQICDV